MKTDTPIGASRPIDRVIGLLVQNLNCLPGLTTTSSCQGHHDARRPHVAFVCDEDALRLILKAITVLNSEERSQVRAYVEILDYDGTMLDVVLRFHHLIAQVKPERKTVREWHRRIRAMNDLVEAELESGFLRRMKGRPAFRDGSQNVTVGQDLRGQNAALVASQWGTPESLKKDGDPHMLKPPSTESDPSHTP